jgi:hypothetical protein
MQVASLVSGVQKGLALGEGPVTLVAPNLQVMVASALVSETGNSVLTTPPTDKQTAYGSLQPRITLGPQGLSSCTSSSWSNYAEYSLVQWGVNPYATSQPIQSTLMRFSSVSPAYVPPAAMTRRNVQRKSISFAVNGVPAYTVALQFSTVQEFNFSASADYSSRSRSTPNFTLPACTVYDGSRYVPCKSCNISSYTNYNVTYSCFDIEQLCPKASIRRRLKHDTQHALEEVVRRSQSDVDNEDFEDEDEDEDEEDTSESKGELDGIMHGHERILATPDDDSVNGRTMPSSATFGVLLLAVDAQLTTVLSSNPFSLDVKENIAILSLVGCLAGGILLMLVFLRRLDDQTAIKTKFAKKAKDDMTKLLFEAEISEKAPSGPEIPCNRREKFQRSKTNGSSQKSYMNSNFSKKYFSTYGGSCKMLSIESSRNLKSSPRSKASGSLHGGSDVDELENSDLGSQADSYYLDEKRQATSAVVEEFLHKVFSGRSIFKKDWNAWRIIYANHTYFNSFGTPAVRSSRIIRFLGLLSQIMILLLLDTIFFGVFYPISAPCTFTTDKVSS